MKRGHLVATVVDIWSRGSWSSGRPRPGTDRPHPGDIVLARVAGTVYLHLVSAVDQARKRVQISTNRGRVNGWTSHDRVFGICVAVDDVPRPGAVAKTVPVR